MRDAQDEVNGLFQGKLPKPLFEQRLAGASPRAIDLLRSNPDRLQNPELQALVEQEHERRKDRRDDYAVKLAEQGLSVAEKALSVAERSARVAYWSLAIGALGLALSLLALWRAW